MTSAARSWRRASRARRARTRASTPRSRRSRRSCAPWAASRSSARPSTDGSGSHMRVTVLAGGVGGARFLSGLIRRTDPRRLTVIGNTGDDEEFFGLHVAPDLDTVVYTLAGLAPRRRGWGLAGDTFACLVALGGLGLPTWFRLGDRDLATHLARTAWLRAGWPLPRVTAALARAHGVRTRVLPMTDDRVRTFVHTDRGRLPFQEYLVRRRGRGRVTRIEIAGAPPPRPARGVLDALGAAAAVVIAPSHPLVSIGPVLPVPGTRSAVARRRPHVAAVSPLVGGRAVRGPLHRMLHGLGLEVSPVGIARLSRGLVGLLGLDHVDRAWAPRVEALGVRAVVTDTLMRSPAHAARLAGVVLRALEGAP